jgi:hypothetical protein
MARNFVLVRGSYTRYFVIVYVYQFCQLQAIFSARLKKNSAVYEKFWLQTFSTAEIFLGPQLCFAAGILSGLATLMFR